MVLGTDSYILNDAQTAQLEQIYGAPMDEIVPPDYALLALAESRAEELERGAAQWNAMFGAEALVPVYVMSVNGAYFYVMQVVA